MRMQLPPFLMQLHRCPPHTRRRLIRSCVPLMLSGACLGLHFATWSWSIDNTRCARRPLPPLAACPLHLIPSPRCSLTHALLLCSATPVVIIVWAVIRCVMNRAMLALDLHLPLPSSPSRLRLHFLPPSSPPPPSLLEATGCALGFTGICLLLTVSVDTTTSASSRPFTKRLLLPFCFGFTQNSNRRCEDVSICARISGANAHLLSGRRCITAFMYTANARPYSPLSLPASQYVRLSRVCSKADNAG